MAKSGEPPDLSTENSLSGDNTDPQVALHNLSAVKDRLDAVHRFLSQSISCKTIIPDDRMETVSSDISSAIHQIIVNGASLLSSVRNPAQSRPQPPNSISISISRVENPNLGGDGDPNDCDVIELDAVELLAEHAHLCEICGKGFKRDANLRMHRRAHGDQYKTLEALSRPSSRGVPVESHGKTRFSCPFDGCNRNRRHGRFKPLESVVCVRNHFKRSHCPKMFSCHRCRNKSFSVLADLKSHLKHCGDSAAVAASRWRCSCGTSFSRKDKLFGHLATFEGHMPAAASGAVKGEDDGFFKGLFVDGLNPIENYSLKDILGSSSSGKDEFSW